MFRLGQLPFPIIGVGGECGEQNHHDSQCERQIEIEPHPAQTPLGDPLLPVRKIAMDIYIRLLQSAIFQRIQIKRIFAVFFRSFAIIAGAEVDLRRRSVQKSLRRRIGSYSCLCEMQIVAGAVEPAGGQLRQGYDNALPIAPVAMQPITDLP